MKKNMSGIMTAAHKMTKEIKANHGEVDYRFQLGLCISYLYNKEGKKVMVELVGSEKQVAWAEQIRSNNIAIFEKSIKSFKIREKNGNGYFPALVKDLEKALEILKSDKAPADAKWWIEHKKIADATIDRVMRKHSK